MICGTKLYDSFDEESRGLQSPPGAFVSVDGGCRIIHGTLMESAISDLGSPLCLILVE